MSERFTHYELGHLRGGEIVEITLTGNAANVRLMKSADFQSYRNGRKHQYFGGLARQSPVRLQIPSAGVWHVTVDLQGLRGNVQSSIRILPSPLPAIREQRLSSVPSLVRHQDDTPQDEAPSTRVLDVFISHASEDKDEVVRPLANALRDGGLDVWYDEFELRIGDSLRRKIDEGLARSRFGVVILSRAFLGKGWTNYELDGLVTRAVTGDQVLLPVWHGITKQEVIDYSPSLADKLARNTATHTVHEIAAEIIELIRNT